VRWLAPVLLAAVLAFAAGAKLADLDATAAGFRALRLPRPERLAILVPSVELAAAVLLIAAPVLGGALASALLVAFSGLLVVRLRQGVAAPCRCFGGVRTKPIGWTDLVRNGVLAALAVVTLALPPGS